MRGTRARNTIYLAFSMTLLCASGFILLYLPMGLSAQTYSFDFLFPYPSLVGGTNGIIVINGNVALDAFCAGNGTDGMTPTTAHVIKNMVLDANGSGSGIVLKNTNRHLIIQNCSAINATPYYEAGFYFSNVTSVTISGCNASQNWYGFYFDHSRNNTLLGNIARSNNDTGFLLEESEGISLSGNLGVNNAFEIYYSYNNQLLNNNASQCSIWLYESYSNLLSGNSVTASRGSGLLLKFSDDNTIQNNTINRNAGDGIHLWDSERNIIVGNQIEDNIGECISVTWVSYEQWYRWAWLWNTISDNGGCLDSEMRDFLMGWSLVVLFAVVCSMVIYFTRRTSRKKRWGGARRGPKLTIDDMRILAGVESGQCRSTKFKNTQTPLLWECEQGHQWEATPEEIHAGRWCPQCKS